MEKKAGFANLEEFLTSKDELKHKLIVLKRTSNPFMKKLTPPERIKFWLALIPEPLADKVRNFYRLVKVKNSVKVLTKHKVIVDYDTLFLAKQINESDKDDYLLITNARLSMMRSVICLFLAYTKDADYHRGWSHIAYALMSLGAGEEETLLVFTHLIQNVLPNYHKTAENYAVRSKITTEFYLLAERQRFSFCNLSHNSIFKSNKDDAEIFEYADPRTKLTLFHNANIKNYGLFTLLKTTSDEWFGSLFSNILFPKDCLIFWDYLLINNYRLLYKMGLTILTKANSKLEQIIKKEKKIYAELGVEIPQHYILLAGPSLRRLLTHVIPSNDFNSIMNGALDRRDSAMVLTSDKKTSAMLHEIPLSLPVSRLNYFCELKKELGEPIPLDMGRVLTINQIIEEFKGDKITIKDFMSIISSGQFGYPSLAVKIFVMTDVNLKGYLTKKDLKIFFIILTDTFERKIKLLWKEITKEKNYITAEESIDILQTLDYFLNPDSTIISEHVSALYERLVYSIPDLQISCDNLIQLIKYNQNCNHLLEQLQAIEGKEVDHKLVHTESDSEEVEAEKTENDFKYDKSSRSQRLSSPTYPELSSLKGRLSNSRKSGFLDVDQVRSGIGNLREEFSITEDLGRSRNSDTQTPKAKGEGIPSISNTDENLPGTGSPSFLKIPIMNLKKKLK